MRESWWERENKSERQRENERRGRGGREFSGEWERKVGKEGRGGEGDTERTGREGQDEEGRDIYVVRDDAHSSTCPSRDVLYILLCGPLF